jgi:two-component system response regulator
MGSRNHVNILLVDSNPDQAALVVEALGNGDQSGHLHWARDGEEALDFLHRRGRFAGEAPFRPTLILLDLKLAKVDGREVLRQIKSDSGLKAIPVVVLTSADRKEDIAATYRSGANSFVAKPAGAPEFVERIRILKAYWLLTNRLPEG